METMRLLGRADIIRRQNEEIANGQRAGKYWTHTLENFRAAFEEVDIEITHASKDFYGGYADLVVGSKRCKWD